MLVALRLLSTVTVADVVLDVLPGSVIHAEGRDDLEFVTRSGRILTSVKSLSAKVALVTSEYERLRDRVAKDEHRLSRIMLALVGPQPADIITLEDHLHNAREMLRHRKLEEQTDVRAAFYQRWPQLPSTFLDDGFVATGFPRLHTETFNAEASQLLRRIAPFTDYTDERTNLVINELTRRMSAARHNRGSVTFSEIRDMIFTQALPGDVLGISQSYVRTRYGYVKSPSLEKSLKNDERLVTAATRSAMKRYRKATRTHRLSTIFFGPVRCIACNGPLFANLCGYTRNGIACSRCGFQPFVSLFYACSCGWPILLVAQPSSHYVDMAQEVRDSVSSARCTRCSRSARPEGVATRIFQLGIPWPPEGFSDRQLIEGRTALGWDKSTRGFRNGKTSAIDALLTEAVEERNSRLDS